MKRYLNFIILFSSFLCAQTRFDNISLEIIFLPKSQTTIYKKLESLINNAQSSVKLAMYWLTYEPFIDKLIELKQKNIDVQVVLDESMLTDFKNGSDLVARLNQFNIYPLISLSKHVQGVMHNKFIVIDDKIVFTGSANFTKAVLDPGFAYQNDENILVLNSEAIASLYARQFDKLKKDIIRMHIRRIADELGIAHTIMPFTLAAYENVPEFKEMLLNPETPFSAAEKNNLIPEFPILKQAQKRKAPDTSPGRPISDFQRRKLEEQGIDSQGMSYDQAYEILGKIMQGIPVQSTVYEDSSSQEEMEEEATPKQIGLLRRLGVRIPTHLTKSQASALIGANIRK